MANVSSSNGLEKRPKLRFPGFDEPWKDVRLSDVTSFRRQRTKSPKNVYVSTENLLQNFEGIVAYLDIDEVEGIAFMPGDTLLANIRPYLKKAWLASFEGICSADVLAFSPEKIRASFLYDIIARDCFIEYVMGGVKGSKMPRGDKAHILEYEFAIPKKSEQEKISAFLASIDHRIKKQREMIDVLKKYKRGLSDELLGEKESGERWMTVPFSEAFELLQNNTFSRDEMSSESGIAYNIHYGDVLIKYGVVVDLSKSNVPYIRSDVSLSKFAQSSYLRNGDIVIADTAEDYTVGKAVEIVGVADTKALSGLHTIPCRPKISFAPMYLGYFINSKRFRTQILPLVQGTKVSSISKSEIQKTSIAFPSFEVQSQIASMLYALDHRIDICQACVQGLVRTKEALLQQLFI